MEKGETMCGIVGFQNLQRQQFIVDDSLLTRMHEKIVHRGPDAAGVWSSQSYGIGLASRRLQIVDLSMEANQPMISADEQIVIIFNGEIYNFRAIRTELEGLGYRFKLQNDTEVILYAYQEWGIDCLKRFDGMFAFALFDKRDETFWLVRDRLGVKPLYFSLQGGVLSFASEIKALWELPWLQKNISSLAWYHYLTFMVSPAPMTIFEGVYKLPAGFYAKIDRHKRINFTEWYSPVTAITKAEQKEYYNEVYCIERITDLLQASVKKRMVADVPVGAFLSGGLDSSLNVALMAGLETKIKTFTIAFADNPEHNEFSWARKVASYFGTEHHELVIGEKEAFDYYETMVESLDEPLADVVCIPFYYVSKLAHDVGMKVVQVGEGADELFFGYKTYSEYVKLHKRVWYSSQRFMPTLLRKSMYHVARPLFEDQPLKADIMHNWAQNRALFWGGAIAFSETQKRAYLDDIHRDILEKDHVIDQIYPGFSQAFDSHSIVDYHLKKLHAIDPQADIVKQMMYLELKQRLPELLLMRADKMSMAASIEAREPFLDHHLVEFMMHVPGSLKFKHQITKYLLKKVAEQLLPKEVIYREKIGFGAPLAQWFGSGAYFPRYFQQLSYDAHYNQQAELATPLWQVSGGMNKNDSHRAVQNWVLQQLWAFTGHRWLNK